MCAGIAGWKGADGREQYGRERYGVRGTAEPVNGPTTQALCMSAPRCGGVGVGGLEESAGGEREVLAYDSDLDLDDDERRRLLEPIEPNQFLFSDGFCLPHHALQTVFTHCA